MSGRTDSEAVPRGRRRLLAAVVLVAVMALAAVAVAQPPIGIVHSPEASKQGQLRLGAGLFAANCASCHGGLGEGVLEPDSRGAGNIEGQGPSLRGVGAMAPDFYLRTGRMPLEHAGEEPERERPLFSDREIRALTAYVASFGGGPPIPHPHPDRANLSAGMSLFADHCAGCHQIAGQGGYVTGARVPVLQHATPTQIAEAVRIGPYVMPRFSARAIDDADLDKIIAYVQSTRHPVDAGGLGIGHIGPVPEGIIAWFVAAIVLVGVCALIGKRARA